MSKPAPIWLPRLRLNQTFQRSLLLKVPDYMWILFNFFSALQEGLLSTKAPESLVFVTWNIDGLDQTNLKKRTKGVCKILEQEAADIVFLQEVLSSIQESGCDVTFSNPGDTRNIFLH